MASDDQGTRLLGGRDSRKPSTGSRPQTVGSSTSGTFNGPEQVPTLLRWQAVRCLGTVVLVVFFVITIQIFFYEGNFDTDQKNLYNFLVFALILVLGWNLTECFKQSASILRWRLQGWATTDSYRDKVMEITSLLTVLFLGLEILFRRPEGISRKRLLSFSIVWAGACSLPLFAFTVTTQDGLDYNGTYTKSGTVNATNLRCYFANGDQGSQCPVDVVPHQATANLYGEMGRASDCGIYTDISEVRNSREKKNYFCRRTPSSQEFAFRFYEYNPDDQQRTYPFFTNRTVTASAGKCNVYPKVTQAPGKDLSGDLAATNYTFTNGSFTDSISIPKANDGLSGTTYIYRGIKTPGDADSPSVVCGPRCLWIWVHKAQGPNDNSTFYNCPITVNEVSNASHDYQKVNDVMARTAVASIALHGGWTGTFHNRVFTSFNFFAAGTDWDVHDSEDPSSIGAHIAEFSIASLSTMAYKNPSIQVPSNYVPHLGTSLNIQWGYTVGLCVFIVGLHAVIAFTVVWLVRDVVATVKHQR